MNLSEKSYLKIFLTEMLILMKHLEKYENLLKWGSLGNFKIIHLGIPWNSYIALWNPKFSCTRRNLYDFMRWKTNTYPNRTNSWELFIFHRCVLTRSGPSLGKVRKPGWCPQLCALVATLLFAPLPEGRFACRARGHRTQFRLQESSDRKWAAHVKTGLGPKRMQLPASAAQASLDRKLL